MNTHESIIDVEAYVKEGKEVPNADSYQIRIDKEKYVVHQAVYTGRELLTLAGKIPVEQYRLDKKLKGGATGKVELDDVVNIAENGIERFMTMKLDQTEG
jgi:hypothetical protein